MKGNYDVNQSSFQDAFFMAHSQLTECSYRSSPLIKQIPFSIDRNIFIQHLPICFALFLLANFFSYFYK